jgi:hypothetical protein
LIKGEQCRPVELEVEGFCVELRDVIDDLNLDRDEHRSSENWRGMRPISQLIEEMEERV